jgi:peptide/nickel transport system permease protein
VSSGWFQTKKIDVEYRSNLQYALRRLTSNRYNLVGGFILLIFVLCALFAPLIAPYEPTEIDLKSVLKAPGGVHLLGTDKLGRDILSRILHGSSVSLIVGVGAVSFSFMVGCTLGMIAGFVKGAAGNSIMRFMDALWSFPSLILALTIATVMGPGIKNIIIAVGITFTPGFARIMYAQVLVVQEEVYVRAARALGASNFRLLLAHVFPNCLAPLIVYSSLMAAQAIIAEAGLSFLGIGVIPPRAAWGSMLREGYPYLRMAPWVAIFPGAAIFLLVLAFNFLGDGLRDALDVKLTQKTK